MIQMSPEQQDVRTFQWKFDVPMAPEPAFLDPQAEQFRIKFMQEELDEFKEACAEGDMLKAADALVDLAYVLHGTALMMGLVGSWTRLWNEVQRANMAKERATSADQSKRGSTLDVIKPAGWAPPNHSIVLGRGPWPEFDTTNRVVREHKRGKEAP
jgi:predicted HAD superfamily Cof-like phosphohydrolase